MSDWFEPSYEILHNIGLVLTGTFAIFRAPLPFICRLKCIDKLEP